MAQSACILIFNAKNQLLIQVRSRNDDSYPSHWDFSAAGGVETGETPDQAAKRELKEELGVELDVNYKTTVSFEGEQLEIYTSKCDEINFHPNYEVEEVFFLNLEEIKERHKAGQKLHPEFIHILKKLFF